MRLYRLRFDKADGRHRRRSAKLPIITRCRGLSTKILGPYLPIERTEKTLIRLGANAILLVMSWRGSFQFGIFLCFYLYLIYLTLPSLTSAMRYRRCHVSNSTGIRDKLERTKLENCTLWTVRHIDVSRPSCESLQQLTLERLYEQQCYYYCKTTSSSVYK